MVSRDRRRVVLGIITGAHGIRGEVRLKSFTEDPAAIAEYGPLRTSTGDRLEIKALRPVKNGFVAQIDGIVDRNQAEALKGIELFLERDKLPDTEDEEFYHADLIGLVAVTVTGEHVGKVIAVHDFGAGDLLEIDRGGDSELIAFTAKVVPTVDIAGGRIVVDAEAMAQEEKED